MYMAKARPLLECYVDYDGGATPTTFALCDNEIYVLSRAVSTPLPLLLLRQGVNIIIISEI